MKTIGLIGGMSWESTVTYYQVINEAMRVPVFDTALIHAKKAAILAKEDHRQSKT